MRYPSLVRWIVLLITVLLSGYGVLAQDTFTETPTETPTLTETPTETPTLTEAPTLTETPTETLILTETPTTLPEATEEVPVTDEVTATASVTAEAPALPAEPPLTQVENASFDSSELTNWSLEAGWSLIASEGGQALQSLDSLLAATWTAQTPFNGVAQARFELDANTTARLGVRQNATGGYAVTLDPAGNVTLLRANAIFGSAVVPASSADGVQWRTLRLSAFDNIVRVAVDGVEVLAVLDAAPLPPGTMSISAVYTDMTISHTLLVDDFVVWISTAEVPQPTAVVATETPTSLPATPTPAPTTETAQSVVIDTGEPRPMAVIPPLGLGSPSAAPPANNDFIGALAVSSVLYTYTGSTTDATLETGELGAGGNLPTCAYRQYPPTSLFYNYLTHTVWHRFTAPAAAEYNITTFGSKFDTVLGVYSGSAVNALTEIACHDGYTSSNSTSSLNVALTQGQVVYVQVGGFYGSKHGWFGGYTLQIKANVPQPAKVTLGSPANASRIDDLTPALTWNAAVGALDYDLQMDTTSNFAAPLVYSAFDLVGTSHIVGIDLPPGTYYWRVSGENLNEQSAGWSSIFRFTVGILRAPTNGKIFPVADSLESVTPTFQWYALPGATNYQLQIDDNSGFSSPDSFDAGTATTFTLPELNALSEGNYYWRVNTNLGVSPASWTFTVSVAAPAVPVISAPTEGQFTNLTSLPIQWNAVAGAAAYQIQIDDSSNFGSLLVDQTVGSPDYTFNTTTNKLYYARVRSISSLGVAGKWHNARRFTIDTAKPLAPGLSSPATGSATNDTTPLLAWKSSSGANFYRIQIDNDVNFGSVDVDHEGSTTSFTPDTPLNQGTWYWHVLARDAAGNWSDAWSQTRSFMVTIMKTPLNSTVFTTTTSVMPKFTWYALPTAVTYQLQIATNSTFTTIVRDKPNLTGTSYTLTSGEALSAGVYYWRVNTNLGLSPVAWTFTVSPAAPGVPAISSPTQSQMVDDLTPTIDWGAVTGATTYQIQIDDSSNFGSLLANVSGLASPTYTYSALGDNQFYVRVRAVNNFGVAGKWSSTRRFTVDTTAPAAPELKLPANELFTSSLQPKFDWNPSGGATHYDIEISFTAAFTGASVQTFTTTRSDFIPASGLLYRTYYWRVRASDALDHNSAWSDIWQVTIAPATSIAPNLNRTASPTPTLAWTGIVGAVKYELQVDNNSNFKSLEFQNDNIGGALNTWTLPALGNGKWYWRVRVRDSFGVWSSWSSTQTFIIEAG